MSLLMSTALLSRSAAATVAAGTAALASPVEAGGSTCEAGDLVATDNPAYDVENTDGPGGSSCLTVSSTGVGFTVASSAYSAVANDGNQSTTNFIGYFATLTGCRFGVCLQRKYPIQASLIERELTTWSFDFSSTGQYDATYDMFFNKTTAQSNVPSGGELMIWLNHHDVNLTGPQLADVTIEGTQWHVFSMYKTTPIGSWHRIAFERATPTSSVNALDISPFVQAAIRDGAISPTWYQQDLEAGFEIWSGGVGLKTYSFAAGMPNAGPEPLNKHDDAFLTPDPSLSRPWGTTFTINPGDWQNSPYPGIAIKPTSFNYLWSRCDPANTCTVIGRATGPTYITTAADVGDDIVADVRAVYGGERSISWYRVGRTPTVTAQTAVDTAARAHNTAGKSHSG
jgi:cellulose 1,4-beta-cellobiosidase